MMIYVIYKEENIVGNGGNVGYQNFLYFPHVFNGLLVQGS